MHMHLATKREEQIMGAESFSWVYIDDHPEKAEVQSAEKRQGEMSKIKSATGQRN